MKNLSAILALAILLTVGLACSDSENAAAGDNTTTTTQKELKTDDTANSATGGESTDDVTIEYATLHRDDGGGDDGEEVESFKPTDNPQYIKVKLSEFGSDNLVKAVFTAVNAGGAKNFKLFEKEMKMETFTNVATFNLSLAGKPFPVGDYKVDIYVNDKLAKTVNYKVQ
ncbi:MAG: hypothetical protein M3R14_14060 [Acidobacteriota bacterium]|nr:hypothetical protein [Acidobacteriota bacterium]